MLKLWTYISVRLWEDTLYFLLLTRITIIRFCKPLLLIPLWEIMVYIISHFEKVIPSDKFMELRTGDIPSSEHHNILEEFNIFVWQSCINPSLYKSLAHRNSSLSLSELQNPPSPQEKKNTCIQHWSNPCNFPFF